MMSRESVPYVSSANLASPLLGKSEIVSQSWIWAIPGGTVDMVEYVPDDGPALKKVEGCGSIEGRDFLPSPSWLKEPRLAFSCDAEPDVPMEIKPGQRSRVPRPPVPPNRPVPVPIALRHLV